MKNELLEELSKASKERRKKRNRDVSLNTPLISIENDPAYRKMKHEKEELEKESVKAKSLFAALEKDRNSLAKEIQSIKTSQSSKIDKGVKFDEELLKRNKQLEIEKLGLEKSLKKISAKLTNENNRGIKVQSSEPSNAGEVLQVFPEKMQSVIENYFKISNHFNPKIRDYYQQLFFAIVSENLDENREAIVSSREFVGLGIPSSRIKVIRDSLVEMGLIDVTMVQKDKNFVQKIKIL